MSAISNLKWTQFVIRDVQGLPGTNIAKVITSVSDSFKLEYVILSDISGAAHAATKLKSREGRVLKLRPTVEIILNVKQFDWGDFFLFSEYPKSWIFSGETVDYPQLIVQTDVTIRAIDDTYIYVYTRNEKIVKIIQETYILESLRNDFLDNLDYPF